MIKNYLSIAIRNILKHKVYTVINVLGLGLGIGAIIVIFLFARYELTYDRFHENAEDIYLLYKERITPNGIQPTYDTWMPLLDELKGNFPEIETGTRVFDDEVGVQVGKQLYDQECYYVDESYFEVFDFPLARGNNKKPFSTPNSAIISRTLAHKFFGDNDPLGEEIRIDFQTKYIIAGIMEDFPKNSSVGSELIVPITSHPHFNETKSEWNRSFLLTYVSVLPGTSPESMESKFPAFIKSIWNEEVQKRTNFKLLPLHQSYDTFIGDSADSYILLYIALGIMIIISTNFMNLTTARSMERAKEIGMRKMMGAAKRQLITQFLSEAIFMTFASLLIGIILAELMLPFVNTLFSMDLYIPYLENVYTLPLLAGFGLMLGLISGSYPGFYLSNFKILETIKGGFIAGLKGAGLRNVLVVVQFTLSIVLIIGTLIIFRQLNFMKNTNLAFNKENLIVVPISPGDFEDRDDARQKIEAFRNTIAQHHSVKSLATSRHVPGRWTGSNTFVRPEGWEGDPMRMRFTYMDANFFDTYEIALLEGQGFLPDKVGDQRSSVVINQAALKAFGWNDINDKFIRRGDKRLEVVGLIQDFNYETLRTEIQPILHFHRVPTNGTHRYVSIRAAASDFNSTLNYISDQWDLLDSPRDFDYFFVEEDLKEMYATEDRLLKMVSVFSILSIFVSCLGLFGLSAFIIDKRRKEVGIRKVFGASALRITLMISNNFTRLVILSFCIASPIAYWAMKKWLEDFTYHIDIGILVFLIAMALSVIIAWTTVSLKSLRAALANPVDAIREE